MNSRVVRDYFRSFKMKKKAVFERLFTMLAPFWVPILYSVDIVSEEQSGLYGWIYFFGMIVLTIGMLGIAMNPLQVPKVMYLCPLSEEERKEYLSKLFQIRFWIPASIFIIGRGVAWILLPISVAYLIFDVMLLFAIYASNYLIVTGDITLMWERERQPKLMKEKELAGMGIKSLLSIGIGGVLWLIMSTDIEESMEPPSMYFMGFAIVFFIWQLYLTIRLAGYKSRLISFACDYERMWVA